MTLDFAGRGDGHHGLCGTAAPQPGKIALGPGFPVRGNRTLTAAILALCYLGCRKEPPETEGKAVHPQHG
jgi:hypothetical protein